MLVAPPTIRFLAVLICTLAVNNLFVCRVSNAQPNLDESLQIEEYLRSLDLDNLVIEQLEKATAQETDPDERRILAKRLGTVYADQLMYQPNPPVRYQTGLDKLLQTYPELSTFTIRLALLQAQYSTAEKQFFDWWYEGRDLKLQTSVLTTFTRVESELRAINGKLESDYQERLANIQTFAENRDNESKRMLQTENLLLHSNYLLGWSSYFRGILDSSSRKQLMKQSDGYFRNFLQIEPDVILNDVDAKWFDYSSDWNVRGLIGLSMCQRALNHDGQADYCLKLVETNAINQRDWELRFAWKMNSRIFLDDFSDIQNVFQEVESSRELSKSGRIAFWGEALKASKALASNQLDPAVVTKIQSRSLAGLAKLFQAELIESFMRENDIEVSESDFRSTWVRGYLDFYKSEQVAKGEHKDRLMGLANERLSKAIDLADGTTDPHELLCCQFLKAKLQLKNKNHLEAARDLERVSLSIHSFDVELAAEAQWLAIIGYSEFAKLEPRNIFQAIRAIDQANIRFPGSKMAKRATFEKLKINNSRLSIEQAIANLEKIKPASVNYKSSCREIVELRYRNWNQAFQSDEPAVEKRYAALNDEVQRYCQLIGVDENQKLRAMMLSIDSALKSAKPEQARKQLNFAKNYANQLSTQSSEYGEFRFYQLRLAILENDESQIESESNWQSVHGKGTNREASALIQLAKLADTRLASFSKTNIQSVDKTKLIENAIKQYDRLVQFTGSSQEDLTRSANARVAYSRLAELKGMVGKNEDAIRIFLKLNQAFPKQVNYIQSLASTYASSEQYELAMPMLKRLIAGVTPGSDSWFEAKLLLSECLLATNQVDDARKLVDQTIRLGGDMPASWTERFEALRERLEQ